MYTARITTSVILTDATPSSGVKEIMPFPSQVGPQASTDSAIPVRITTTKTTQAVSNGTGWFWAAGGATNNSHADVSGQKDKHFPDERAINFSSDTEQTDGSYGGNQEKGRECRCGRRRVDEDLILQHLIRSNPALKWALLSASMFTITGSTAFVGIVAYRSLRRLFRR